MMWKFVLPMISSFSLFSATVFADGIRHAQFRGWTVIGEDLSTRLGVRLNMDRYLPAEGLDQLMGTWGASGSHNSFLNGLPNSLNILIWQTALRSLARDLAANCKPRGQGLAVSAAFRATLQSLCRWPAPTAKDPVLLEKFWRSLMGGYVPPPDVATELNAWMAFFLNASSFKDKTDAAEVVEAMTLAILMNPYFLLYR